MIQRIHQGIHGASGHGTADSGRQPFDDAVGADANLPHVLLVLDGFPKTLGGGERIALRLASLLPRYGFRVSILTFFIHPESLILATAPCPVYLLALVRTWDWNAFRAALALRRFLIRERVAIVQTFFESSDLWAGLVVKAGSRARLVWSRRDMGILRERKHQIAYRFLSRLPDAVFAVSEQVRQHVITIDGVAGDRVTTIPNGIDLQGSSHSVKSKPGEVFQVVTLGNIRRVKGHDLFLKAAATVLKRFPQCSFTVAGGILEPDYFAELEALVDQLDLSSHVRFLGAVAEPRLLLEAADLFVLPSRSEGFSNSIIEAMAASLPVIATDVGGNAEAVEDQRTGLIVPPEDAAALSQAMERLIADPQEARRMGVAGSERVRQRFTEEAMLRTTTNAYRHLLRTV